MSFDLDIWHAGFGTLVHLEVKLEGQGHRSEFIITWMKTCSFFGYGCMLRRRIFGCLSSSLSWSGRFDIEWGLSSLCTPWLRPMKYLFGPILACINKCVLLKAGCATLTRKPRRGADGHRRQHACTALLIFGSSKTPWPWPWPWIGLRSYQHAQYL